MYITCVIVYLLYYIIFIAIFNIYINYALTLHYYRDKYFMNCLQRGYID